MAKPNLSFREAAKIKIQNEYWSLPKIGLQNSFEFIKGTKYGREFINDTKADIEKTEEFTIAQ